MWKRVMVQNLNRISETGAVFTYGKSGFADNIPSHFFIRNDPVVEISCGEEHSGIVCSEILRSIKRFVRQCFSIHIFEQYCFNLRLQHLFC